MNLELRLKYAEKIRSKVHYNNAVPSDIIVNREKFSESSFKNSREENAPVDFIRSRSMLHPRDFLVTTKSESNSTFYDVYQVSQPPRKVHISLDKLYGKTITDMQKEIPGTTGRGRYVSFEKLGMNKYLTEDKIASLQRIVKENRDSSTWPKLFQEAGISDLQNTIDFITNFECTVLSDTTIPESSLQDTLKSMEVLNTRDYRNLKNYYDMAKSNTDIYMKISYINKILYNKPLNLIKNSDNQKQYIKKKDENEFK